MTKRKKADWPLEKRLFFCLGTAAGLMLLEGVLFLFCIMHAPGWEKGFQRTIQILTLILAVCFGIFFVFFLPLPRRPVSKSEKNSEKLQQRNPL